MRRRRSLSIVVNLSSSRAIRRQLDLAAGGAARKCVLSGQEPHTHTHTIDRSAHSERTDKNAGVHRVLRTMHRVCFYIIQSKKINPGATISHIINVFCPLNRSHSICSRSYPAEPTSSGGGNQRTATLTHTHTHRNANKAFHCYTFFYINT